MLRLGGAYLDTAPLPALARPYLTAVPDELAESVSQAVWEDGWVVFVARAEVSRIVATGVRVGARLPARCSATGKVLLAALPDEEVAAELARGGRERRTARTLVDRAGVVAAVENARGAGCAVSDEELALGMRSIAVPVRGARGRTVAAMSVSASTARVAVEHPRAAFEPALRTALVANCENPGYS